MSCKCTWNSGLLLNLSWALHFHSLLHSSFPIVFFQAAAKAFLKAKKCPFRRENVTSVKGFCLKHKTPAWDSAVWCSLPFPILRDYQASCTACPRLPVVPVLLKSHACEVCGVFLGSAASSLWPPSGALRCTSSCWRFGMGVKKLFPDAGMRQRGEGNKLRAFFLPPCSGCAAKELIIHSFLLLLCGDWWSLVIIRCDKWSQHFQFGCSARLPVRLWRQGDGYLWLQRSILAGVWHLGC